MISYVYLSVLICVIIIVILLIAIYKRYTTIVTPTCITGQCPTSLITGQKDCTRLEYDPVYEVCNSGNKCDSLATPYAVDDDLGTSSDSTCQSDNCRCLPFKTCPTYIDVAFDGNYRQTIITELGISTDNFCTISPSSMPYLGCNSVQECMISNICSVGQLAYISNPSLINNNNNNIVPLGCIKYNANTAGTSLSGNEHYVWDPDGADMVTMDL